MQCILTRSDFGMSSLLLIEKLNIALILTDIYYGNESVSAEQPQAFTCPFCGKMGFTEATLQEHVTSEHADSSTEVVRIALNFKQ